VDLRLPRPALLRDSLDARRARGLRPGRGVAQVRPRLDHPWNRLAILSFALALVLWPRATPSEHQNGKQRLALRLAVSTIFTVVLISFAGRLGASLSGILDAIPLTSLMMAFFTRREISADGSSDFLRGVTMGSFSYVAAMFVLAEMWRADNELTAFAFP